ncbi:MAG: glycosyltransferase [Parvularculaceae bacterium]|nr:glycosyltransferase [Parvularculaceae bacterium]
MSGASGLIAIAAGGTGGHMFPAEAVAQELARRGRRVLLVTDARGRRYAANFPAESIFEIPAASPSVGGPAAKALAALALARGFFATRREFRKRGVVAAIGFGGYPSFPAMKAAETLGLPYGLHEQNAVLGRTNRVLAGGARFTAHAFSALSRTPRSARLLEVGNPVRDAVVAAAGAPFAPPGQGQEFRLLIFGGSQGASIFSKAPLAAIAALPESDRRRLRVVQQAREEEVEKVKAAYAAAGVAAEIAPFFKDLPRRIVDAHLVVARAGASTVTELSVLGRPSILVPLAIAMDDHQTGNARALADAGAALVIAEKDFDAARFGDALGALMAEPARLAAMAASAEGRVKQGAAAALADLVDDLAGAKEKQAA